MQSLAEYLSRAQHRGELRFMLIGGRSLEAHGYVRNTKDVDLLITTQDIPVMERLLTAIGYRKEAESGIFSRWRHSSMEAEDVDLMFVGASSFESLNQDCVTMRIGSAKLRVPSVAGIAALKLHAVKNNPERFAKDAADILSLMRLNPAALDRDGLRQLCEKFGNAEIWTKLKLLLA